MKCPFLIVAVLFLFPFVLAEEIDVALTDETATESFMESTWFIYVMVGAIVVLVAVIALVLYKILSKPAAQQTWPQPAFPSRSGFPGSFPSQPTFPQQPSSFPPQGFPQQPQFTPPAQQPAQDPTTVYIASCLARGMSKEQIIAALVQNRWTVLQARAAVDKYLMMRR